MKLISLNTWGGRAGKEKLLAFFKAHADVDIFCLQEIWSAPYKHLEGQAAGGLEIEHGQIQVYGLQEISATLDTHIAHFRPHHLENYGLLMLVRKDIEVLEEGDVFVHKQRGYIPEGDVGNHARNLQYVTFATEFGPRTTLNLHGLWDSNNTGKADTPDRLKQSDNIAAFLKTLTNPYVLAGDFNLLPDTESLKRLEDLGLRNLIKEYGITSTRTSHYKKPNKFADYVLTSEGIKVLDFKVMPDEVSDHAAMYVEFE